MEIEELLNAEYLKSERGNLNAKLLNIPSHITM